MQHDEVCAFEGRAQQIHDEMKAVYRDEGLSYSIVVHIEKEISKLVTRPSKMSEEVDAHH